MKVVSSFKWCGAFEKMSVTFAKGFLSSGAKCGIKKSGKLDLTLIYSIVPAVAAGAFTSNVVKAAPVKVCLKKIKSGRAQAVIVNSGNANCGTGEQGVRDANEMARVTARALGLSESLVLVGSTGLIGKKLQINNIKNGVPLVVKGLGKSWRTAARGIMTTDTRIKSAKATLNVGGKLVKIGGMCKGAGMICPNMATMLCFITTDANIGAKALRSALKQAVSSSFNCITVDGDMSTNDSVIVLANGKANNKEIKERTSEHELFVESLKKVCLSLAKQIVADGEGATKFVEVEVVGAASEKDAREVGKTVANSNLVKTAIYGEDPNCGRILGAAGRAHAKVKEGMTIWLNGVEIVRKGVGMLNYDKAKKALKAKEIKIKINLHVGKSRAVVWTCDLTHDYVTENSAYWT